MIFRIVYFRVEKCRISLRILHYSVKKHQDITQDTTLQCIRTLGYHLGYFIIVYKNTRISLRILHYSVKKTLGYHLGYYIIVQKNTRISLRILHYSVEKHQDIIQDISSLQCSIVSNTNENIQVVVIIIISITIILCFRYWLSSAGVAIHVPFKIPLYVSMNASNDRKICFISKFQVRFLYLKFITRLFHRWLFVIKYTYFYI